MTYSNRPELTPERQVWLKSLKVGDEVWFHPNSISNPGLHEAEIRTIWKINHLYIYVRGANKREGKARRGDGCSTRSYVSPTSDFFVTLREDTSTPVIAINTPSLQVSKQNNVVVRSLDYSEARKKGFFATTKLRIEILYQYKGRCFVCGIEEWRSRARLDMHRVVPGRKGGLYTLDNVIPVCGKCHNKVEGLGWEQLLSIQSSATKGE